MQCLAVMFHGSHVYCTIPPSQDASSHSTMCVCTAAKDIINNFCTFCSPVVMSDKAGHLLNIPVRYTMGFLFWNVKS